MINNRQSTKIQLALTIYVGPNQNLVVRVEPNRTRIEFYKFKNTMLYKALNLYFRTFQMLLYIEELAYC